MRAARERQVIGRGKVREAWEPGSEGQFIMTCGLDLRGTVERTGVLVGPYIFLGARLESKPGQLSRYISLALRSVNGS